MPQTDRDFNRRNKHATDKGVMDVVTTESATRESVVLLFKGRVMHSCADASPLHMWAELSTVRQRRNYELACHASALVACQALSAFRYSGASRGVGLSRRHRNHTTQMADMRHHFGKASVQRSKMSSL